MGILPEYVIVRVHRAAVTLVEHRTALLTGIRAEFVATLPLVTDPATQTLSDIRTLNEAGALTDGTIPLSAWLMNATILATPHKEAEIITEGISMYIDGSLQVLTLAKALECRQPSWRQQPRDRTDQLAAYFDGIARC